MATQPYEPPSYKRTSFNCPHCNAFAHQIRKELAYYENGYKYIEDIDLNFCQKCIDYCLRKDKKMIYPPVVTAPLAHEDMPEEVKIIYEEARQIANISPRAAAALLRVALERLTEHLGEIEGTLNTRIGNLKKQGLPERVIQGLDIVRITANEGGSHAGQIDLNGEDNTDIVNRLFELINFIIEKTITENIKIDSMFNDLPEEKKDGIKNRDKK